MIINNCIRTREYRLRERGSTNVIETYAVYPWQHCAHMATYHWHFARRYSIPKGNPIFTNIASQGRHAARIYEYWAEDE